MISKLTIPQLFNISDLNVSTEIYIPLEIKLGLPNVNKSGLLESKNIIVVTGYWYLIVIFQK